jgi:hypothetical protein
MSGLLFTTNELKDAVFSLTLVNDCLAKVFQDNLYWKWVFIALHNALQGFMVTSLCPFNDYAVIRDPHKWEAWRKDPSKNPQPNLYLLKFMQLYPRIKDPTLMERFVGAKSFKPSGTQDVSVERLNNELRNDFTHFMPMTKLRPVEDFLPVVKDVIGIIWFLAFDSVTIGWADRNELRSKTKSLITIILANISELEKVYAVRAKQEEPRDPELEAWAAALLKRCEETAE